MKRIYAVLDIGSTTLKLLVAELMSTNINIHEEISEPCH